MKLEFEGIEYEYTNEELSILEFLESKNIQINSECRDGFCGACRCKLEDGEVEVSPNAIGYVAEDEILACSTKPKSNVKIKRK